MTPSVELLKKLPVITAGQADNPRWISKRMETISSTRFHSICVRRPATSSARLVKEIVTGKQVHCNWQMNHGVECESIAISCFERKKGQVVQRSNDFGLFADKERWWLVTSPDGICDSGLVEVKTITNIQKDKTIKEAAQGNLVSGFFLRWDPVENRLLLKREHKYYYQIQGQLNIIDKETCFLIAFVDENDLEIVEVQRDIEFWKKMLPKLDHFWEHCLLPELIDSRLARNMDVRELPEVIEAQSKMKEKKKMISEKKRKIDEI